MKPVVLRRVGAEQKAILGSDAEAPLKLDGAADAVDQQLAILGSDAEAPLKLLAPRATQWQMAPILGSDAEAPLKLWASVATVDDGWHRSSAAMPRPR